MQDRYVGDAGDFGKYGLLRTLLAMAGPATALGVNWYYFSGHGEESADGRHCRYLDPGYPRAARFRVCFPEIYDGLQDIVRSGRRHISAIEAEKIIGRNVTYYSAPVPDGRMPSAARIAARLHWFEQSLCALADCDILFLDPDNGMQAPSMKKSGKNAGKYFFFDECSRYFRRGQSLILYQHRNRLPKARYDAGIRGLHAAIDPRAVLFVLRSLPFSVRDYIMLVHPAHEALFTALLSRLTHEKYACLYARYEPGAT
ncbi:MAG: hypothetical protein GKC04_01255 [Methanomicrobiales archaeon]|nr:hypothetical protein [Methanomicrobiales archaeon]